MINVDLVVVVFVVVIIHFDFFYILAYPVQAVAVAMARAPHKRTTVYMTNTIQNRLPTEIYIHCL